MKNINIKVYFIVISSLVILMFCLTFYIIKYSKKNNNSVWLPKPGTMDSILLYNYLGSRIVSYNTKTYSIENESKYYDKHHKVVLDNINYKFENKQKYLITGESGSGKTTLLNIIAGYTKPDKGNIIIENNICIEYLFQDELLYNNLTVYENLFIKYNSTSKHLADFDSLLNLSLKTLNILDLQENKVNMLSGGERQRVQLASIFMSNPDLILMDEPTAKLDPHNSQIVARTINEVFYDKTIILVSHTTELFKNYIVLNLINGGFQYEN